MFDGLDRVPWPDLHYAYSGRVDVPALFRALMSQDDALGAADELLNELYHQGGFVGSAAVAAMPFLVEAAESAQVACRAEVLEIVGRLARTARKVAPRWIAEAWTQTVARLLVLLDDDDRHVRRVASSVLEEAVDQADEVVDALRARWDAQDDLTRLDQILVIGSLARSLTAATLPETLIWLRDLTRRRDEQVVFAATLALAKALPGRPAELGPIVTGLSGDVTAWAGSEHAVGTPAGMVQWAATRLGDDFDAREEICVAMLAHPDPGRRRGAVKAAADLLSVSRRPRRLLPALREHSADSDLETRTHVLHLLAAHARPGGGDADLFAEHLHDQDVADVAVWGLAWSGDERCLPELTERIGAGRPGYSLSSAHTGKSVYMYSPPSLQQVLAPCASWAPALLPAVLQRLHPNTDADLGRTLLQTLKAWGPSAAPAVPRIIELLYGPLRHWAADTLGAIGPDAASAGPALRALLDDPQAGLDHAYARRSAAVAVPWAYWRVTGDPEPALHTLGSQLGGEWHTATHRLADLGGHAVGHVPTLRLLARSHETWTAVEAAHALIRITGDVDEGVRVLMRPVRDLLDGTAMPVVRACVRYLAELDDLPAGHLAAIEAVLAVDHRLSWDGGWAAIHDDQELRAVLQTIADKSSRRG
ncbi:hypothetical protein Pth03_02970 [Planotetraspora thailandica]|uniref:PBS lyase n=1 Tax=Planotetraspora thailandica TaxID=487172 RepID=A0A8J3UV92_9ACTN|nr:hypothetical protein [Planotetraspora thailandica]GII51908.1 hypothetical protein Pth03_02970 [Planotetraspora thailandica]